MAEFHAIFATENTNPTLVRKIFQFRHAVFVEECGWDLQSQNGRERDEFDGPTTVHMALLFDNVIVGSFRANCTIDPYLCEIVFAKLAESRPYPKQADIWEISRFGVAVSGNPRFRFEVARVTYALMFHFAKVNQLRALVAATDLTYERFLTRLDIVTRRYGQPKVVCNDAYGRPIEMVAGEIPLAAQNGSRIQTLLNDLDKVEIIDETHVLGFAAIST